MDAELLARIRAMAETLHGGPLGPSGDALIEMAARRACSQCCREDIPPAMEQAVAALALNLLEGDGLKSLKRGDTAMTFETRDVRALLAPFRRLGRMGP